MVKAAGAEPDISVENTQLADSENAGNSSYTTTSRSSVQIRTKISQNSRCLFRLRGQEKRD